MQGETELSCLVNSEMAGATTDGGDARGVATGGCVGADREAGAGAIRGGEVEGVGRPCRARGWRVSCPSSLLGRGGAGQRTPTGAPHGMWVARDGQPRQARRHSTIEGEKTQRDEESLLAHSSQPDSTGFQFHRDELRIDCRGGSAMGRHVSRCSCPQGRLSWESRRRLHQSTQARGRSNNTRERGQSGTQHTY